LLQPCGSSTRFGSSHPGPALLNKFWQLPLLKLWIAVSVYCSRQTFRSTHTDCIETYI
jgi:hypothetical protein